MTDRLETDDRDSEGAGPPSVGVVVNPERSELGDTLVDRLRRRGCAVTTASPDTPDGIADAIDEFVTDGVDVVAAVGGDGTQRTAAAQLLGTVQALAVIPGGTVNLLARVLGLDDVDAAVDTIVTGEVQGIDLGLADGDVFVMNASTGWDAALIEQVDDGAKRFGRLGYAVTGIREWIRAKPGDVRIELDGRSWYEGTAQTVYVLNVAQRGSASFRLAPDARLDDGLLDVLVLRHDSVMGLLRSAWARIRGIDPPERDVVTAQAAEITVEWSHDVPSQRDGDPFDHGTTFTYRVEPHGLDVIVPHPIR